MPVVFVYGLPENMKDNHIDELYKELVATILNIQELNLQSRQITFFFPSDRMKMGLGEEIVIFVKGLIYKKERTDEVRQKLAKNLGMVAKKHFPNADLVECFIEPFNLQWGFSSSNP